MIFTNCNHVKIAIDLYILSCDLPFLPNFKFVPKHHQRIKVPFIALIR